VAGRSFAAAAAISSKEDGVFETIAGLAKRIAAGWRRPSLRAALIGAFVVLPCVAATPETDEKPPETLAATGLYTDFATLRVDPRHLPFSPQYPLWTDGAAKRRWISLPPGTAIDGSDPEAWVFPVGTRIWKEFSFGGRRVETRYLEHKGEGRWLYAAYAWSEDGREAPLVSIRGRRAAYPLGNGKAHAIPGVTDCKACHEGGRSRVLGFSALQLSSDRDPQAPHAEPATGIDLTFLVEKGLLVGYEDTAPRIEARSGTERAALGYLHGNCGHCHNERGSLSNLGLFLRHVFGERPQPAVATTFGHPVKKPAPGQSADAVSRIAPGDPDTSAVIERMSSRYPALQMPPLGTEAIDEEAVSLLRRWIAEADRPAVSSYHRKGDR
jgi:hypothetical protein